MTVVAPAAFYDRGIAHGWILRVFRRADSRFTKRVAIVCDDDEEAKRFTKQMVDGHAIELWHEARKITTLKPEK